MLFNERGEEECTAREILLLEGVGDAGPEGGNVVHERGVRGIAQGRDLQPGPQRRQLELPLMQRVDDGVAALGRCRRATEELRRRRQFERDGMGGGVDIAPRPDPHRGSAVRFGRFGSLGVGNLQPG